MVMYAILYNESASRESAPTRGEWDIGIGCCYSDAIDICSVRRSG
jgi:hypothetical protein